LDLLFLCLESFDLDLCFFDLDFLCFLWLCYELDDYYELELEEDLCFFTFLEGFFYAYYCLLADGFLFFVLADS